MKIWEAVKEGLKKSYKTVIKMAKILIPVYFFVALLKYVGILEVISGWFSNIMVIFGLPGDAALVLLCANCINIYAALGVIANLSFTVKELTILGTMICLSHSLPVETSVIKGLKIPIYLQILIRLTISLLVGILMNLIWRW
ncbi:MAG: nucleoside recognition protein [Bacilli bacterium]|nr:nucleoside recognition protein [Bacilli bacterium]